MKTKQLSPTYLYADASHRLNELMSIRDAVEKRLSSYPEGKIHVLKSRKRVQYYLRLEPQDKSGKYIRKGEYKRIRLYLQKHYDEEIYRLVTREIINIEKFLNESNSAEAAIQKLYSNNPTEIKAYLNPIDISTEDYVQQWLSIPYEKKEIIEVKNTLKSDKGDIVRSKSELNIANMLYKMNIPYKYECPIKLANGYTIYPDFTVLDIKRRTEVYWEHRGMMDDREYAKGSVQRLKEMGDSGIILGDNLIITEETLYNQLSTTEIERVIKHYFLFD